MKYTNLITAFFGNVMPKNASITINYEVDSSEEADKLIEQWREAMLEGFQGDDFLRIEHIIELQIYSGGDTTIRIRIYAVAMENVELETIERYFVNGVMPKEEGGNHE